ncbi:NSF, partial [Symbiodinium pilosum]
LSSVRLIANVRRSRKGAAPGPSGCTGEHLRVLLDDEHCAELLLGAARKLAIAQVPGAILPAFRLGRMVALSKPSRDVRALVMGDAFRRLVARTLAQQLSTEFQRACAPFQFALSTKAGAEALARVERRILGVWADTLPALGAHHPGTLADLVRPLLDVSAANMPPSARAAEQAAQHLRSQGFDAPPWASLLERDEAAAASRSQWEGGH